jgi:hypothetical protein
VYVSDAVAELGSTTSNVELKSIWCSPRWTHTRRSSGWQKTTSGCPGLDCAAHLTATAMAAGRFWEVGLLGGLPS